MALLHGEEALAYAERTGRAVYLPAADGDVAAATPLSGAQARALSEAERARCFLALAYSGYVVSDRDEILLQRVAENPWGFDLTDGTGSWPGGIDKASQVRPIKASLVPDEIRQRLDPLRIPSASGSCKKT